jgi:flavin reductase (DIM6/NTAB) family NADH-FMN oxidoreductase RutF
MGFNIAEFRQVLGSFLTGVTVVTGKNEEGEAIGFTANSFTSVSLEPPLILVCLAKSSFLSTGFKQCQSFVVNILSESQRDVSATFASPIRDRFEKVETITSSTGNPIIKDITAWLDCELHEVLDGGDHLILMGRVLEFNHSEHPPLGYLRGNYLNVSLEEEVTVALENPGKQKEVGAIIEHDGRILLIENENNLNLPASSVLGNDNNPDSLKGLLASMGLETQNNYLFAVYETQQDEIMHIYYRAEAKNAIEDDKAKFFGFDEIPFDRLPDNSSRTMLQRYVKERKQDAFGIYVGDETQGDIKMIRGEVV